MTTSTRRLDSPICFTVREVALAFGAHPETIRRWVRAGLLGASKAGRRNHKVWISGAAIDTFFNTRKGVAMFAKAPWG